MLVLPKLEETGFLIYVIETYFREVYKYIAPNQQ